MKKLITLFPLVYLMAALAVPASAIEYKFDAPSGPEYGKATSVEVIHTTDSGAVENTDVSKNAALIPPAFGGPSAYALNTGSPLTPNLAPGYMVGDGAVIYSSSSAVAPPALNGITSDETVVLPNSPIPSTSYTKVTSDLYYSDGRLGTLKIPAIGLTVKVYQGTGSSTLAKGAGHFEDTSLWDGNVCIAAHNRGVNDHFGKLHTLEVGDTITWATKLGTRTYEVTSVSKVRETDTSGTAASSENCLTLYTCVQNQSEYRWMVRAAEV